MRYHYTTIGTSMKESKTVDLLLDIQHIENVMADLDSGGEIDGSGTGCILEREGDILEQQNLRMLNVDFTVQFDLCDMPSNRILPSSDSSFSMITLIEEGIPGGNVLVATPCGVELLSVGLCAIPMVAPPEVLDLWGHIYGIYRNPDESNETFRHRLLERLRR